MVGSQRSRDDAHEVLDATPAPEGYHSEAEMVEAIRAAFHRCEHRSSHAIIGRSVEGRALHAVTIAAPGRVPSDDRPLTMIQGGMHGIEVIGTELALALLDRLTAPELDEACASLLEVSDVTVVPCVNPDGRQTSMASLASKRWYAPGSRRNANRVDLNRNWPRPPGVEDHWLPISGTPNRHLPWYRGASPLSEPECRALLELIEPRPPVAMLDLHSSGQILVYPWTSKVEPPADLDGFRAMVDALRARQTRWRYKAKQSRAWYPIVGSMDDYMYDQFGSLMLTVEIGRPGQSIREHPSRANRSFWFANPVDVAPHLDNDATGCVDALTAAVAYRATRPERPGR